MVVKFDLESADAIQLLTEIIRIAHTIFDDWEEYTAEPTPESEQEVLEERIENNFDNNIWDLYMEKLAVLLATTPPNLPELVKKLRQLQEVTKQQCERYQELCDKSERLLNGKKTCRKG